MDLLAEDVQDSEEVPCYVVSVRVSIGEGDGYDIDFG
jgi:hypothetical protein